MDSLYRIGLHVACDHYVSLPLPLCTSAGTANATTPIRRDARDAALSYNFEGAPGQGGPGNPNATLYQVLLGAGQGLPRESLEGVE